MQTRTRVVRSLSFLFYGLSLVMTVSLFTVFNRTYGSDADIQASSEQISSVLLQDPAFMGVSEEGDIIQVFGRDLNNLEGDPNGFVLRDYVMRVRSVDAILPLEVTSEIAMLNEAHGIAELNGKARLVSPDGLTVGANSIELRLNEQTGQAVGSIASEVHGLTIQADRLDFSWGREGTAINLNYQGNVQSVYIP